MLRLTYPAHRFSRALCSAFSFVCSFVISSDSTLPLPPTLSFFTFYCFLFLVSCLQVVASAEEVVFALTMLPLVLMVGFGIFRVDWVAVTTPPAAGDVDWRLFIQIMFWTSTYWQKVSRAIDRMYLLV